MKFNTRTFFILRTFLGLCTRKVNRNYKNQFITTIFSVPLRYIHVFFALSFEDDFPLQELSSMEFDRVQPRTATGCKAYNLIYNMYKVVEKFRWSQNREPI